MLGQTCKEGLGPIRIEKGCPSLCKGERLVRGGDWKNDAF